MDKKDTARTNVFHKSEEPTGRKEVHGYDFNKGADFNAIMDSFAATGYQATHLARAIDIINRMRADKCTIYLGYTSNMVSSGLRDVFRFIVQHKLVDVIVTTAGGFEEDLIKCLGPFLLGEFDERGAALREQGINRIGNILVPNSRYEAFEDFLIPHLTACADEQQRTGHVLTPSEFIARLGTSINHECSIYYWASKHGIPVFCPALTDGSIGDMLHFFSYKRHEFKLDIVQDIRKLNNLTMDAKRTGIIILGSGIVKHHICNANMMRNGADYAVYINTAQEFDGSDAGARPDEAVSWGKILPGANSVKVFADATIVFPLIVAKTFAKWTEQ
ncbi:deoxyhypusine synthase [Candidatus Woesearchaeota archaeon]|nr:deoxyhypusine synthase [Candidatus Woesearchaeota archaeon]